MNKNLFTQLLSLFLIFLLGGCSLLWTSSKEKRHQSKDYYFKLKSPWQQLKSAQNVDQTYVKNEDGSIAYSSSYCDQYQDESLRDVLNKSLLGIRLVDTVSEKNSSIAQRRSLEVIRKVELDGVYRFLSQFAFKRDHCYYEIQLITEKKPDAKLVQDIKSAIKFK